MPSPQLIDDKEAREEELGGQMSFLDHLDELRKRLIRCIAFVLIAAFACWFLSDRIYNFLAKPVQRAQAEARQRRVPVAGLNGELAIRPLNGLKQNGRVRFICPDSMKLGSALLLAGASVLGGVAK